MTTFVNFVPSSVTYKLIDSGVGAGGNAISGSGLFGDILKGAKK